jgi:hypothetical protein
MWGVTKQLVLLVHVYGLSVVSKECLTIFGECLGGLERVSWVTGNFLGV